MSQIPPEHIVDAHSLQADGEIHLYELTAVVGGTVYFKADDSHNWQGNTYEGLPLTWEDGGKSTESGSNRPTLTIGDENINLLALKPLLFDGNIDGGSLVRHTLLLDDLLNNRLIMQSGHYKIRNPSDYGRSSIKLELARWADSLDFSFPFHQYYAPDFPTVSL